MSQKKKTVRRGHKLNSWINGEWGCVKKRMKRFTSHVRRQMGEKEIKERLANE